MAEEETQKTLDVREMIENHNGECAPVGEKTRYFVEEILKTGLDYKGYHATVEFSVADNTYFGKVIEIEGLVSFEGKDIKSLKEDFEGAVDDYLN